MKKLFGFLILVLMISGCGFGFSTGPIHGRLTNALNGEPIENMNVVYTADAKGMPHDVTIRRESYPTNQNGEYKFSKKFINFKTFSWERVAFNRPEYYTAVEDIYDEKYHLYSWTHTRGKDDPSFMGPHRKWSTSRLSGEFNAQLMPKVNTIEECNKASSLEIKNDCISLNAYDVAISTSDSSLCDKSWSRTLKDNCLYELGVCEDIDIPSIRDGCYKKRNNP